MSQYPNPKMKKLKCCNKKYQLSEDYSKELAEFINLLLEENTKKRPTIF